MKLFENENIHVSKIYTVGLYKSEELFSDRNIRHYNVTVSRYEMVYFLSGESLVRFGNTYLRDEPGAIRYLPKGVTEGEYTVEKLVHGECIDIYFDTPDPMPPEALILKNMHEVGHLFVKAHRVWQDKGEGYYAKCLSILYEIISCLQQQTASYLTSEQSKRLRPAMDYMTEHLGDSGFDYRAMCAETGLSYNYFKNLFIKQYGRPPVKHLTALRMERARELLITGQYSVTEIAAACGFDNVYYFSTVFKKHFGVAPSSYKTL